MKVGDFVIAPFYDCDMTCTNCENGVSTSCLNGGWWGADDRTGHFADGAQGELVRVPHAGRFARRDSPDNRIRRSSPACSPSPTSWAPVTTPRSRAA
ncbi:MAG: alcohol dehydrogenase catalytic domain-containing protein [Galbitalea sp.]